MAHEVIFSPAARQDLLDIAGYITDRSGEALALPFVDRIESLCDNLHILPGRGVSRSDLGPRVRVLAMERRVRVVYRVAPDTVTILRVLYGGRELGADDLPN